MSTRRPTKLRPPRPRRPGNPGWLAGVALAFLCSFTGPSPGAQASPPEPAPPTSLPPSDSAEEHAQFERQLNRWDLDDARRTLERAPDTPQRTLRSGIVHMYAADYERAEAELVEAISTGGLGEIEQERAQHFLSLSRGAQVALGDAVTIVSGDGRFEAVFADAKDQVIAPYLFDAMAKAYDELGADIGVRPEHRVRFEILDEPGKLAMVTPLSLDAIYTTGTVGITKYRRIMMVSPRVMLYGYGWLDTAVHEYVHYLVTMRTGNAAPVWLQEGLAKLLETRWRTESPPPLDPGVAALLHRAIVEDELITLEKMHPSIAMLPSQEKAALAYAEVETMLGLLHERGGATALGTVMDDVAAGDGAKQAIAAAWGDEFSDFQSTWRKEYERRTAASAGGRHALATRRFREGDDDAVDPSLAGDVFSHLGGGKARQHARLGVLLTLRGHKKAAVIEYEKARTVKPSVARDPKLARRLGELYLELERPEDALPLLVIAGEDAPDNPNIAAAEGRARLRTGDVEGARVALARAIAINPFVPTLHCDLAEVAESPDRRRHEQAHCRQ